MIVIKERQEIAMEIPASCMRETIELERDSIALVVIADHPSLDLEAVLAGEGASLYIVGTYRGKHDNSHRLSITVRQSSPRTTCDIRVRAALADESSLAFEGLVRMEEGADASRGFLSYRALLLSDRARSRPVPRMEVLTKRVASARHEAAVGTIDGEQIFYLQSRGMPRKKAISLIAEGFLNPTPVLHLK